MIKFNSGIVATVVSVVLAGCVQMPTGPDVKVMPAPYKPFDLFVADDANCREFAKRQIESGAQQAENRALGQAAAVTAVGAVAGALLGGNSRGTGVGAGVGLIAGTAVGSGSGDRSSRSLQQQYDSAYEQCMYAYGNQVPGYAPIAVPPPPPPQAPPRVRR